VEDQGVDAGSLRVNALMVVVAFVMVLKNAAWWSKGGGIGMDGVSDGV
jgi:hypothetical protein